MKHLRYISILSILPIFLLFINCESDWNTLSTENETELAIESEMGVPQRNVVFVAMPTGEFQTDRASIETAVAQAEPGDIIQFDKGTYYIGNGVPFTWDGVVIDVPNTTLQGHPGGTTLKGGDNIQAWGEYEGLILTGGNQTVRHLTFESFSSGAINLNYDLFAETGGYVVEKNIFRNSVTGIYLVGQSDDISYIRHNSFNNVGFAFQVLGKTGHVKWNTITATDPDLVPILGQPYNVGGAGAIFGPCENNIFAFNKIEGIADGIWLDNMFAGSADAACRNNLILGNKFFGQKVFTEYDLGTMAWLSSSEDFPFENNKVINNTLFGSSGIGIFLQGGTETTIDRNSISGTRPLPNSYLPTGFGICLDENSHQNNLANNRFMDNENFDIALFGNNNTVMTNSRNNKILDEGGGNVVSGPGLRKAGGQALTKPLAEKAQKKREMMRQIMKHYIEKSKPAIN